MTAPSCFALLLFAHALGPEQITLPFYLGGFLFGQIPLIVSYLIFHKTCVGVQQAIHQNFWGRHISGLVPVVPFRFPGHQRMTEMVESVKERGVLSPVLVRPMPDGGYQMVSGHRRKFASELAELPTVPCIVRELTDDEAIIIMVDSNLQRERVLPSEKAFAYKMKFYIPWKMP